VEEGYGVENGVGKYWLFQRDIPNRRQMSWLEERREDGACEATFGVHRTIRIEKRF